MENLQAKRVVVLGFRCDVIGYDLARRGFLVARQPAGTLGSSADGWKEV